MFLKVFIVVVALPFLTSAIPTKRDDSGVLIHLGKRQSLSKPDGTFDLDKAIAHTVAVRNKHRQNLINLERNVGGKAFNEVEAFLLHCYTLPFPHFVYPFRVLRSNLSLSSLNIIRNAKRTHSLIKSLVGNGLDRSPLEVQANHSPLTSTVRPVIGLSIFQIFYLLYFTSWFL